jgi:hypothetical protein
MSIDPIYNEEILNAGLNLAMEWGEDWLKPIQQRLARKYPGLTEEELNSYNEICRKAMKLSHSGIEDLSNKYGIDVPYEFFVKHIQGKLPWITEKNLSRAYSQGMYYIRK